MSSQRAIFRISLLPIFSILLFAEGCSVFGAIGDAVGSGYENTVTYFNLYYNARRAFRDAETEITADAKVSRGKPSTPGQPHTIPAGAQKNLDLVIDKCSNILAYHGNSSLVDNALMMIGKAFFYRAEYSKAQRKFSELISQYPDSPFVLEAQLWYTRTQRELDQSADARNSADALIAAASQKGEQDILAQAYSIVASLYERENGSLAAIEFYQKSVQAADDDALKGDAWAKIGQLYSREGQFDRAAESSLKVEEYSDDPYTICQSKLLAASAYRNLKLFDKALSLTDDILKDYRFKDYKSTALLERANVLLASGHSPEAIDLYRTLDTLYARSEAGGQADIELANYFESSVGDYAKARDYYSRAATVPGTPRALQANHKVVAFNNYFNLRKELATADSLYLIILRMDSSGATVDILRHSDTTAATDSSKKMVTPRAVRVNADTLKNTTARAAATLGELFYTDLANPDSAFYWLRYALQQQYTESSAPRILYILVELARTYPDKSSISSQEYRNQLTKDFPRSYFARQIQNMGANPSAEEKVLDPAQNAYDIAEGLIESGKNDEALDALQNITTKYPRSSVSAKSQYAMGWLYENRLAKYDSAAARYKQLVAQFPTSPYAMAVNSRMFDTLSAVQTRIDTLSKQLMPQSQKTDTVRVQQTANLNARQNTVKPLAPISRRARILQETQRRPERE